MQDYWWVVSDDFILFLKMATVYFKMVTAVINRTTKQTEDSTLHYEILLRWGLQLYKTDSFKRSLLFYVYKLFHREWDVLQTSELLFSCRKLTSAEALSLGLVSQVLDSDNFHEHLLPIVTAMANQSSQVCNWVVKVNTEPSDKLINAEISLK